MQRDVARIVGIVENISSFATRDSVEFTMLDVGEVIGAAHDIIKADFRGGGIAFEFENRTIPAIRTAVTTRAIPALISSTGFPAT